MKYLKKETLLFAVAVIIAVMGLIQVTHETATACVQYCDISCPYYCTTGAPFLCRLEGPGCQTVTCSHTDSCPP